MRVKAGVRDGLAFRGIQVRVQVRVSAEVSDQHYNDFGVSGVCCHETQTIEQIERNWYGAYID